MVNDNIQLHFDYEETTLYSPDVQFLNRLGIKPSPIYDVYWKFAVKRQGVFQARLDGEAYPWTNDSILLKHKFTNVYRASDRVSQYLIRNVIYSENCIGLSPEDIFFRTQ